ncbi:hypothetical protein p2A402 (plasmid) [Aromatoleum aromaticum EbN1]|uniref:DUF1302 domain-containing protein n=1 Tax=Aromatoleum aromaticum (strain DSM 19018 / LMG 30748 / EbN1) TaxID=76114 RepID=Q5NW45_AROAE|nr:DUF1302 family protein [Aromatoleum aromaticum]CAI10719.1 hypothetical protein p2A402 [Aromatoleum aromaticum EbN1]
MKIKLNGTARSTVLLSIALSCNSALGEDFPDLEDDLNVNYFKWGGYVRTWMSWNLADNKDVTSPLPGTPAYDKLGGRGDLSTARASLQLTADAKTGPITWRAVGRADREKLTSYGEELEERSCRSAAVAGMPSGPGCDAVENYNQEELREFYGDFNLGDRVSVRLGKQQVVFGETDFFHPNDLLHGFDYRWRAFGEPESDELRKPLIMANIKMAVPEARGTLQLVVRPGWDRKKDIGNTYDIFGGRWAASPNMGVDYLAYATDFNYKHSEGDYRDVTGALRWTGLAGDLNYALSYQRVFQPDFVLNPCGVFASAGQRDATGCAPSLYYKEAPKNKAYGDWIYPIINVFGGSVSGESRWLDAVVNFEMAYHKDRLFNSNTNVTGFPNASGFFQIPNNAGVMGPLAKKDVIQTTLRIDKQLRLEDLLGTNAPSFASVQVFDTWVQDWDRKDDLVAAVGSNAKLREHATIATAFVQFPYMNSRLTYGLAYGRELQAGNSFFIPSVSYNIGNNWRIAADAVFFQTNNARRDNISSPGSRHYGMAAFNNHDYGTLRVTYQF